MTRRPVLRDTARVVAGVALIIVGNTALGNTALQRHHDWPATVCCDVTALLGWCWLFIGGGNLASATSDALRRRAERRRRGILLDLAEHGPTFTLDLCKRLGRGAGSIYPDLGVLERQGRIVGEWEHRDDDRPRRRMYRLASDDERMWAP